MAALKPLSFSQHALDALDERELDLEWSERTVWSPEWTVPDPYRPGVERRFLVIPEFGDVFSASLALKPPANCVL